MKLLTKSLSSLAILGIFLTLSSCNLSDVTTNINTKTDKVFKIDIPAGSIKSISIIEDIDISNNDDVQKNKSKIKKYTVIKVSYIILNSNITSTANVFNGKIMFSEIGGSNPTELAAFSNLSLVNSSAAIEATSVSADNLAKLAQYIENPGKFKIALEGSITDVPAKFDFKVIFDVKLKVGV